MGYTIPHYYPFARLEPDRRTCHTCKTPICSARTSWYKGMKSRHHCYVCGISVCGDHSPYSIYEAGRHAGIGIPSKLRACSACLHKVDELEGKIKSEELRTEDALREEWKNYLSNRKLNTSEAI